MRSARAGESGRAAFRRGAVTVFFLALALTAGLARAGDNARFVTYLDVPDTMEPEDTKTVTVRMLNTGTTTWERTEVTETTQESQTTTKTSFALRAVGDDWGVGSVNVSGSVKPNATYAFQFTITAPTTPGTYVFQWRMARDTLVVDLPRIPASPDRGFGATTPRKTIVVEAEPKPDPDVAPSFDGDVEDQEWLVGEKIKPVTLPGATGGNGTLSYSFFGCRLPAGVRRTGRLISGTPESEKEVTCTWKVTDSDDNTAESDAAKLTFKIEVKEKDTAPKFESQAGDLEWLRGEAITEVLPKATGGNGELHYALSPDPPLKGVTFDDSTRTLSGKPTAAQAATEYVYTVMDSDDNTAASDSDTQTFKIEVKDPVLIVSPKSLEVVEEGEGKKFTVKLGAKPTGDVTVSLTRADPGAVETDETSLTFTADNYGKTQPVEVTGRQDDDAADETTGIGLNANGGGYGGVSESVEVKVEDEDKPRLIVEPTSLTVAEGGSVRFTVKLATRPTRTVTVSSKSGDADAVEVEPASLTFAPANFGKALTVTVRPKAGGSSESTDIGLRASGGGYDGLSETVTVRIDRRPRFSGTASNLEWTTGEEIAPVTLPGATGGNGDLNYSLSPKPPEGVTFDDSTRILSGTPTKVQAATEYTYTVTDSDDNTAAGDSATQTFKITVTKPDPPDTRPVFKSQAEDQTWVTDEAVSATLPVATGGNGTLKYSLSPSPPAGVTFNRSTRRLSGTPTAAQTAKTYTYTVTDSDDNTATSDTDVQTFTIAVVEPEPPDTAPVFSGKAANREWVKGEKISPVTLPGATGGNGALTYALSPPPPAGVAFDGSTRTLSGTPAAAQAAKTYTYTVTDSDDNTAASDADEQTFTIAVTDPDTRPEFSGRPADQEWLAGRPIAPVVLPGATGGDGELAYALSPPPPAGVTFDASTRTLSGTPTAVQTAKTYTYTVTDSDDNASAGDSDTAEFTIAVKRPALVLNEASLRVAEGGAGPALTVKLAARPTGDVTVELASADTGTVRVSPSRLTFTPADHGAPQPVTVAGVEDADTEDGSSKIGLRASGGGYDGVTAVVDVTVADDDADTAPEFGVEAADLEWLAGRPIAPVVLPEAFGGNGDLAYALSPDPPAGVTFDSSTRTLSGTPAATQSAAEYAYTVTDADDNASAGDSATAEFTIAVKRPALVLSRANLTVEEGAAGATFTVKLAARPMGDVTVAAASADPESAKAAPSRLTFTPENHGTPRPVTVTAVGDDDEDDEDTVVDLRASGGGYDGLSASLAVTVADDDADTAPAFGGEAADLEWLVGSAIVPVVLPEATGGNGELTYALSPNPPAGVTFEASTRTLSGTPAEARKATVHRYTVTDSDGNASARDGDTLTFTIGSARPALVLSRTSLEVEEGAAGSTFTVKLAARPKGDVTVNVTSGDAEAALASPSSLTFAMENYATPRPVTVTAVEDDDRDDEDTTIDLSASGGGYAGASAAVAVTVTDDDANKASDDASFVSYAGVPATMRAGAEATVTVRMRNTGTTTWTTAGGYALGSQRPEDNRTWGLSRVPLPSEVAPNETADFTFAIAAPTKVGKHDFRWKMVRGADGWFGRKTALRRIEVDGPSFGEAAIPDMTWARGEPIEAVTLPEAVGGDGALTYSLAPELPEGATFTEATRTLAGTPSELQGATRYTYAATDADGDAAELSFSIEVEEASTDDAAFVSISGLPSKIAAGDSATVTVTMKNTGTTTWTTLAGYALGSRSSPGKDAWGARRAALPGSVAPNEEVAFEIPITAPATTGGYTFAWRMVRDPGGWFGEAAGDATVIVEDPSFGDAEVPDRTWIQDEAIETLTLPEASGTAGPFTYALTPALPDGVTFDTATRVLSGTPTTPRSETEYAYTATDANGGTATLAFSVTVEAAVRDDAAFVSISGLPSRMAAGSTATVTVTMENTGTTTWTTLAGYALGSQSSQGKDTWGARRAPLPGSVAPNEEAAFEFPITAPAVPGSYGFAWRMVRDPGGWFGAAAGGATVIVEDPSFGDAAIPDQTWVRDVAIVTLPLPAARGTAGPFSYSVSPSPPDGVIFTESTRTVAGMPTKVQAATKYAYTATDANGKAASLSFTIEVKAAAASASRAAAALPPPEAPTAMPAASRAGAFDMFAYWLPPHGRAVRIQARLGDGTAAAADGAPWLRSFWRGELWGRKLALLGDPAGERYDIFEEVDGGLDYWGTFEGAGAGAADRSSWSLDRPFRWMHRHMAVGDAVESPVTGWFLSNRARNRESALATTMRLEVLAHHASFTVPAAGGPAFEDVLEVRFQPDANRPEAHDTFHLARGYGAVYSRRSTAAASDAVVEWWAVEKALVPVVPSAPSVPWFDPFSPGWPKTAVVNGNMDDIGNTDDLPRGVEGGPVRVSGVPGWTADSDDAAIARPPAGIDAGPWAMVLRGSGGGGDSGPDAVTTTDWIPVEGGTYRLSACMLRESAADNVFVDFDDGAGRDASFDDAHLVAALTGAWECRAVTKCIPASVGAVRVRAARDGANVGDAWFDGIELQRVAACTMPPREPQP